MRRTSPEQYGQHAAAECRSLKMRNSMKRWNVQTKTETLQDDTVTANTGQPDPLMTFDEIAAELRCSKGHASKILAGKVRGVTALPSIRVGTRVVVRRSSFEIWKAENESIGDSCYPEHARNSRDERMGEKTHA